jgi:hypothetical protein
MIKQNANSTSVDSPFTLAYKAAALKACSEPPTGTWLDFDDIHNEAFRDWCEMRIDIDACCVHGLLRYPSISHGTLAVAIYLDVIRHVRGLKIPYAEIARGSCRLISDSEVSAFETAPRRADRLWRYAEERANMLMKREEAAQEDIRSARHEGAPF